MYIAENHAGWAKIQLIPSSTIFQTFFLNYIFRQFSPNVLRFHSSKFDAPAERALNVVFRGTIQRKQRLDS